MREENRLAEILGAQIRAARKAKGLASTVCAKYVKVSQPAWNMWEMGKRLPKIELLVEICDLLGSTPNDLLGYVPPDLRASASLREIKSAAPKIGAIKTGDASPVIIGDGNTFAPPLSSSSSKRKGQKK